MSLRTFSKVLKLMALLMASESSYVTACPLRCIKMIFETLNRHLPFEQIFDGQQL